MEMMYMTAQRLIIQPPKDETEKKEMADLESQISFLEDIVLLTNGQEVKVPLVISQTLIEVIKILNRGDSITLIPMDKELTTQQAADILNVSRPYFVKLLEKGEIPFRKIGAHRRVLMQDLMQYRSEREIKRKNKLKELTNLSQEMNIYD